MAIQFPTSPNLLLHYLGKTEQTKYALKWTTSVNKLEIRSHTNLITVVWANEVHRLLSYYSTSCYPTHRWWHICISAGQCTSASACKTIELLELQTPDRLCLSVYVGPPTALTSIWPITSCGGSGHATAGLSDDVQGWGWTQKKLVEIWTSWAEHYWLTLLSTHARNCLCALCSCEGLTIRTLTVAVEQLYGTFG